MEIRSDADAAAVDPYRAPCPEEESSGALVQPESSSSLPTRSANTTPDHPYSLQPGHHVALPPSHPRPAQRKAHEDRHPAINRLTYIPYLAPFDPFGTAQPSLSSTTSPITHGNSHGTSTPCFADAKTHQQHYSKIELGPSTFSSSLGTPATTTSGNSTPDFINPDPHKQLYARIESGNPSPIPGLTPRRPQPPPQQSQPAAPEPSRTSNLSTNHLPPSQSTNSTRRIPRKPLRTDSPPTLALEPPQNPLISPDKPLPSPPTPSDPRRYTHGQVPTRARKHANVNGNDNDETTTQTSPAAAKKPAQSKTKRTPTLKSLVRAEIRRKRARASRYLDELGDAYRKGGL
ncbi:hypothetical protein B0A50_01059 [Salinomyces thailandicus]|uniref:Uncharacterized protein n=1 Tax=Salinomyces thailandicus TaxID=706561 RepID=A0A4U0UBK3_9PEZI|nr:hypothetical protein B0A50_01059 [Salinomyces thailandica]